LVGPKTVAPSTCIKVSLTSIRVSVNAAQIGQYLNDLGWPVSAQSGRR